MAVKKDLGPVSAYAIAVANGFTGTEAEWTAYIQRAGQAGGYADQAEQSAQEAAQSAATFKTDTTLTVAGKAADAKVVRDEIESFRSYSTNKFSNLEMTDDSIREDVTSLKADLTAEQEARESAINAITMAYNTETKKLVVTLPEAD